MIVRRLLWPAATAAAMFALTIGLGVWQLQRLAWKQDILAAIDRGEAAPPIPIPAEPQAFARVIAEGRFLDPVARYGAEVRITPAGAAMGAHLLSPLARPGGPPIIVDRGWAPLDFATAPPPGPVRIEGYIRPPEHPPRFANADDPLTRRFFALDPAAIGAALGLPGVAPYTLVELGPPGRLPPGQVPEPAAAMPRPPNNHLVYALTWFGLAAALAGVFATYVRQTLRRDAS